MINMRMCTISILSLAILLLVEHVIQQKQLEYENVYGNFSLSCYTYVD